MTSLRMSVLLIALLTITAACSGESNRNDDGGGPPPPSPPQASYALAVTSVDVVNKDTGEALAVGGLPAQGGELTVP